MLPKYLLFFFILRICFPGVKELESLISIDFPDAKLAVEYGMHLYRDLLQPQMVALAGSARFEIENIHHTMYGSYQFLSRDGPTMCLMMRNILLMMSNSRSLLNRLLGNSQVSKKITAKIISYLVSQVLIPTVKQMGQQESRRLTVTLPLHESIRHHGQYCLQLDFPFISLTVYDNLKLLVTKILNQSPQFQIKANEMTCLVLWAALENLRLKELDYTMFNMHPKSCISDNRTFIDRLRMASAEMIWSWATRGSLLSRGMRWFMLVYERELFRKYCIFSSPDK
jgi:hypothetical protein